MRKLIALTITVAMAAATAPAALAKTTPVGNSTGNPTMNICPLSQACTYVNFHHGKPTDVVKHTGTLLDWTVNAGSIGGKVQLRILRPTNHGRFKVVHSSGLQTVSLTGPNVFSAHIKVKRGDVLALTNDSSGIYMAAAPAGTCVRYFDAAIADGASGKPNKIAPQLHLLLSADVKS
jgi:hypothetical protein